MSEGRVKREIDRWIGAVSAVMCWREMILKLSIYISGLSLRGELPGHLGACQSRSATFS